MQVCCICPQSVLYLPQKCAIFAPSVLYLVQVCCICPLILDYANIVYTQTYKSVDIIFFLHGLTISASEASCFTALLNMDRSVSSCQ